MPTIFERINGALEGNDLSVRVTVQSETLSTLATTVAGLAQNPPDDLGDLSSALQALPLPDFAISGDFAGTLAALGDAVPGDLSSITGGLTGGLEALEGQLGNLTGPLGQVLDVALAIYEVTQVDLFCVGEAPPGEPATQPSPVQQMNGILDLFPSPLNLSALLDWLYLILRNLNLSEFRIVQVPILDDLRDPLVTLITWRNTMNAAELLGHMNDTLTLLEDTIADSAGAVFDPIETSLQAVNNQLPALPLAQIADGLAEHLATLRTAIQNGDLSATGPAVTAMNTLLDTYTVIQQDTQNNLLLHFAALDDRLATLDLDLDDQMGRLVLLLQPEALFNFITAPPDSALAVSGLGELESWLNTLVEWLQDLLDRIDLSAIQEPLSAVADGMRDAVDALDASLISVTLEAQSLFGEVEDLLDQIDPSALVDELQDAIDNFQTTLADQLQDLFAPARDAVSGIIDSIGDGVDSFDPADIVAALQEALDSLAGVLQNPEVLSAMNAIRDALDQTAQALDAVSFAPVADPVIAEIDKLTAIFQELDTSQLSTPLQLSLQAALAILPPDLTPFSDPLIERLGELVVEGPLPLLEVAQQQPEILLAQARAFEPGALLGGALSGPYQNLLQQMDAFQPSQLLDAAGAELDTLKNRLRDSANPGQLFAPLEPPFADLLAAFDQLQPEAVVEPLETAIQGVINAVLDALPVDEIFQQLDRVLDQVQRVTQTGTDSIALLERITDMLNGLADPRQQMDDWIAGILTNVDSIQDASPLQPALDAVEAALDETTADELVNRFNTASLQPMLDTLAPQERLVKIIQAYNAVPRSQLEALPDSPEKTAILTVLNRFNPVDPAFVPPYQKPAELREALAQAGDRLQALFDDWDSRYHEAGPLAALRDLEATPDNLRQWIREALDAKAGRPIVALLSLAAPLSQVLGTLLARLQALVSALTTKLDALLIGPDSLGGIRDEIQELIDKLQNFNLDFLTESLSDLFAALRGKFEAISPAALRQIVEAAFEDMLDSLQIGLLIPASDIAELDSDYQIVVDKLKTLDPEKLVVEVVQPEFEEKIIPLLEIFDPSDLLTALTDRLAGVEEELRAEMARVNEAYQKMRDSVPSISISIDIDIDVEIPSF
jgi:hypothetical protein